MLLRNNELEAQDEEELLDLLIDQPIAIDVDKQEEAKMSFGDRAADKVSEVAGSWTFVILFLIFLIGWIILNTVILTTGNEIDPYPFILCKLQKRFPRVKVNHSFRILQELLCHICRQGVSGRA